MTNIISSTKSSRVAGSIKLLLLTLFLSSISISAKAQSSDFLNRSDDEIRRENIEELSERADREMERAVDLLRKADRVLGTTPSPDEEIFLTEECRLGNRSACEYLRDIEQRR
jgi:hypothetical protein